MCEWLLLSSLVVVVMRILGSLFLWFAILSPCFRGCYSLHRPEYLELMSSIRERQCPFHEALPVHRHCALGDARQLTDVLCDMYSYIYYEPERLEPPTPKVPADHELELEESWQAKLREFRTQKPPLTQCATAPAAYQWTPTAVGEQVAFTDFDVYSDGEDGEDQVVDFFAR
jgi:hypothetical protein